MREEIALRWPNVVRRAGTRRPRRAEATAPTCWVRRESWARTLIRTPHPKREALTRMTMDHPTREGPELFMREQALANVGLAQGVAMPLGHSTHPILRMRSFLLEKDAVSLSVTVGAERVAFGGPAAPPEDREPVRRDDGPRVPADAAADTEVALLALAWGRSGDKGNTATLAVSRGVREVPRPSVRRGSPRCGSAGRGSGSRHQSTVAGATSSATATRRRPGVL